ncbi:MAG: BLUF domain-containing protein [Ancalomicrobiaceae bacterium]|nr:BLUF domain-containing protein [Ancalomicrobiaceae bacterium]
MTLSRVVFFSRNLAKETGSSQAEMVKAMLAACVKHDSASGITGAVLFDHRHFLQAIEGDRTLISHQLRSIFKDERQGGLTLMSFERIVKREFRGWTIGYAGHDEALDRLYITYGVLPEFDPSRLSELNAFQLLRDSCLLESRYIQRSAPLNGPGQVTATLPEQGAKETKPSIRGLS